MKNTIKIFFATLTILTFCAGGAMAASDTLSGSLTEIALEGETSTGYPNLTNINVSPNVELGYLTYQDEFAVTGWNQNGSIEYGVGNDSADIYFQDASGDDYTTVTVPSFTEGAGGASAFGSDYAILGGS